MCIMLWFNVIISIYLSIYLSIYIDHIIFLHEQMLLESCISSYYDQMELFVQPSLQNKKSNWIIHSRFSLMFHEEVLFWALTLTMRYVIGGLWDLTLAIDQQKKKWKKSCFLCVHSKTKNGFKYNHELWIISNCIWCLIIGVALRKGTVKLYYFLWTMKIMILICFLCNTCQLL